LQKVFQGIVIVDAQDPTSAVFRGLDKIGFRGI